MTEGEEEAELVVVDAVTLTLAIFTIIVTMAFEIITFALQ